MEKSRVSIILVEDHKIISEGLQSAFNNHPKFQITHTASSGKEALKILDFQRPDIVILDLNLPDTNGVDLLKTLRKKGLSSKIVVLTMYNKSSLIEEVKKQGANAYLLKNSSVSDLIDAFECILQDSHFYLGKGTKAATEITSDFEDDFIKKLRLTKREREIVRKVVKGRSVPQIAEELCISNYTVETHKKNIFKKLNIHTSIDLINFVKDHEITL